MHYFITSSKSTYITEDSPSHVKQYPNGVDKNYGGDEILELKKEFTNKYSTSPDNVSRVLVQFDYTEVSKSVSDGTITDAKYYLRLYEVEGQTELNKSYSLSSFPLSQSWDEGTGKHFDNPKTKTGTTWESGSSVWSASSATNSDSGSRTEGGGVWITGSGYEASQSFVNQSGDIEMDITNIVGKHVKGTAGVENNGIILKFSGSEESDSNPLNLKFFSNNTHTIYQPKLEVKWEDSSHLVSVGYTALTMSGEFENHIFIKGLQPTYRETEKVRFRIGCRKKYVQKTFTESLHSSTGSFIPHGSSSYSILDSATNTEIVPFGAYTSMSLDSAGHYFDQWLNTFEPGRYYKVLFKLKYDDGQEVIIDNDEEFKVI